jgi:hypothetical protein
MSGPCPRPECGGEVHTDGWGTPIRCPHAAPLGVACAVLHTDAQGNVTPCPGYPHVSPAQTGPVEPMSVTRVRTDTGSHIEPELDETWDEVTKLRWNAAVVAHDTGLAVEIHPHAGPGGHAWYSITIGEINKGGQTSLSAGPYAEAWRALIHISDGAEAVLRLRNHEEQP